MKMKPWFISVFLIFTLSGCNLPLPGGVTQTVSPQEIIITEIAKPYDSIKGSWVGTLNDSTGGYSYDVTLTLDQQPDQAVISGTLILTNKPENPAHVENYQVSGDFSNGNLRFSEADGRFFWDQSMIRASMAKWAGVISAKHGVIFT